MARRSASLRFPAPPTCLALALAILGCVLPAAAPAGAAAKQQKSTAGEARSGAPAGAGADQPAAAKATAQSEGETKHDAQAQRQAERQAAQAQRDAERNAAQAQRQADQAQRQAAQGQRQVERQAQQAQRQAERVQRRADRAAQQLTRTSGGQAQADAPGAQTAARGKAQRERERELRRRQRELRREREPRHETRKQREAREAREKTLGSGSGDSGAVSQPAAAVAATAPAPAAAAAPSAAGSSTGASNASGTSTRRASVRRAAARQRHARRAGSTGTPLVAALPIGAGQAAAGTPVPARTRKATATRPSHRVAAKPSQLVTTVTRIIGVIPTALWLVIGALGLLAAMFAVSSRVAARRARRLARQREELLEDVGLLQAALLPELPARLGPVGTSAAYRPASGPAAGGDFYDVFGLESGSLAVIVGDVSGHGRDALPHTTLVRFTLRAYLEAGLSPRETLRAAAPVLERQLGGSFATVVIAAYDPRERRLTYACAGHPHPLLTGLDEDAAIIACSAPPIGAGRRTGTRQTVVSIPGAAAVCFYTDGVVEARTEGELFGTSRLARALDGLPAHASAAELLDRVAELTERRPDDMAACLLDIARADGAEQPPFIESEELELDAQELQRPRPRRFLAAAGVADAEADAILAQARGAVALQGSVLLQVRPGAEGATATIIQDNLAPLRARAIARSQEVAL